MVAARLAPLFERLPCFPFVELFPLALALFDLSAQLVSASLIVHPHLIILATRAEAACERWVRDTIWSLA